MTYRPLFFLLLAIVSFISAIAFQFISAGRNTPDQIISEFHKVLHEKEKKTVAVLERLSAAGNGSPDLSSTLFSESMQSIFIEDGIAVFIYREDSLLFWSTNAVPFSAEDLLANKAGKEITKLPNGWYEIIRRPIPSGIAVGLILIQHQYPFENDFLQNNFQQDFCIPDGSWITLDTNFRSMLNGVYSEENIKINLPGEDEISPSSMLLVFFLYLLGFVSLVICIYLIYCNLKIFSRFRWLLFTGFILDVILLRFITVYFHIPDIIYSSRLFSPVIYSSSVFLPSLGDFFINGILFLIISYLYFIQVRQAKSKESKPLIPGFIKGFYLLIFILAELLVIFLSSREMVLNSSVPMKLSDVSGFNLYSFFGIFILASVNLSCILLLFGTYHWDLSVRNLGIAFVILAVFGTIVLNHFNDLKEIRTRDLLAVRLGIERDPIAEILFSRQEEAMNSDHVLASSHQSDDSLGNYLLRKYFGEAWNNYIVQVTVCHPGKTLRIQPQNYTADCQQYFSGLISDYGKPLSGSRLWFLDYGYGSRNYLAKIPLGPHEGTDSLSSYAYIEINSKLLFKDQGYPELLINKAIANFPDVGDYAYAFYRNSKLIHSFGSIPFPLELTPGFNQPDKRNNPGKADYYFYPIDKSNLLVISKHENRFLDKIAPFSYLFFLFVLFSFLFFFIVRFPVFIRISRMGFRERLQLAMSGILLTSLIAIGFLSVYYITLLNIGKNREGLSERAHSILVELEHKLGSENDLGSVDPQFLNELMTKYSNVFFSDVNLFSPYGDLIATSRPEVFENGLISPLMNRVAFTNMKFENSSGHIQEEFIGRHDYSSAYLPFFSENNRLLGYLNLPYFARQDELKKEISTFMIAFINIYAILVIIGFFTSIFVSNYITRPLRLLTESLGRLTLGNTNEKLIWQRNDEVGRLVEEYNRKVDELSRSAENLARSERESAWKEMARQVAHEIKNPLTPMKLSVQHLLRSWDEKQGDWDQRLRRFSSTMIEQIDSLSFIASEFSDFARMPVPANETFDLNEVIRNAISFYTSHPAIQFEFEVSDSPALVLADRKQIFRVFANLINNSLQAIGESGPGKIMIRLDTTGDEHQINVSDTGSGIVPEQQDQIFQPNFTTKSGGMGLGLAIVKSIILASGGTISFFSEPGKGTTFTIILPVHRSGNTSL